MKPPLIYTKIPAFHLLYLSIIKRKRKFRAGVGDEEDWRRELAGLLVRVLDVLFGGSFCIKRHLFYIIINESFNLLI